MVNAFEYEIAKELQQLGKRFQDFFWYRVADTTSFRQISEKIYMLKQPCDYVVVFKGKIYFLELKSSHNKTSFALKYIRSHQITSLLRAEKAGALSYFLINDRSRARHFMCYAIRPSYIDSYIKNSVQKSIKWDKLREHSLLLPRRHQGWNLNSLFRIWGP